MGNRRGVWSVYRFIEVWRLFVISAVALSACGSSVPDAAADRGTADDDSRSDNRGSSDDSVQLGPDQAELLDLQQRLAQTVVGEEAFSFGSLAELRDRSMLVLVATISGIDPGPAELMGAVEDGSELFNETLAISLLDDDGNDFILVQDYGEAVGFETVASEFPVGARALLFAVPFETPSNRRAPDRFDDLTGSVWQTAHPLGFLVLASSGMLVPLFAEDSSSPKVSAQADSGVLRELGMEASGVLWPDPPGR